jgi:hypothetical protein
MKKLYQSGIPSLSRHPRTNQLKELNQFTEGDLHANTMRLIESLVYHEIIEINQLDYEKILLLYTQALDDPDDTSKIQAVLEVIKKIKIKNSKFLVRLIGDTLADRTGNDLFTLTLIDMLVSNRCNIRTLISNHDIHFVCAMMSAQNINDLKNRCIMDSFFASNKQGISFIRLVNAIENGVETFDELKRMAQNYFSTLLLLDYAINAENELEIFSHAPINLGSLKNLAEQFGLKYPDDQSSHKEIIKFIDAVNLCFCSYIKAGNPYVLDSVFDERFDTAASQIIWKREFSHHFINPKLRIINVYGHDKSLDAKQIESNVIRLDNHQGKGSMLTNNTEHTCFATNSSISPMPPVINHKDIERVFEAQKQYSKKLFLSASRENLHNMRLGIQKRIEELRDYVKQGWLSKDDIAKDVDLLRLQIELIIASEIKSKDFEELFSRYINKMHEKKMNQNRPLLPLKTVEKILSTSSFDQSLENAKNKSNIEQNDYASEGKKLVKNLSKERDEFLTTGNVSAFVEHSRRHVKASEPKLKESLGWHQVLLDILNAIIFIASLSISYWVTGKFRLLSTEQFSFANESIPTKPITKN